MSVAEVFEAFLQDLNHRQVLIKRRLSFLLVFQNMVKPCRQLCSAFAVEDYLAGTNTTMRHALFVHRFQRPQHLACDMFQNTFWHCSNALSEIEKAAVSSKILNHWNTTFWTIPLSLVNFDETVTLISIRPKRMLPVSDPVVKHLSDLNIGNGYFFHCVDF